MQEWHFLNSVLKFSGSMNLLVLTAVLFDAFSAGLQRHARWDFVLIKKVIFMENIPLWSSVLKEQMGCLDHQAETIELLYCGRLFLLKKPLK